MQHVQPSDQFQGFNLPLWGANVVPGVPGTLMQQSSHQNGAGPVDNNGPLLTPTSPHWSNTGTNAPGLPPPLNTQVVFQNMSDPAQHSPFNLDPALLSQSPLFTPANFYSPATPQYPQAFAFPPVDWNGANSMATASYIGGRNTGGMFFGNLPPGSTAQNIQNMPKTSMNGDVRSLTDGLGQMSVSPGDLQRMNSQSSNGQQMALPSPGFQYNILSQLESQSPNFATDVPHTFFPSMEQGKMTTQSKDFFAQQFYLQQQQNSGNGSAVDRTQTYANMLRSGDPVPNLKGGDFYGNEPSSNLMLSGEQSSQINNMDIGAWESNGSSNFNNNVSNSRANARETNVKNVSNRSNEHMRNKPYPSHQNQQQQQQQSQPPLASGNHGMNFNNSHSYSNMSRANGNLQHGGVMGGISVGGGGEGTRQQNQPTSFQSSYAQSAAPEGGRNTGSENRQGQGRYGNNFTGNQNGGAGGNTNNYTTQNHSQQYRNQNYSGSNSRSQNFASVNHTGTPNSGYAGSSNSPNNTSHNSQSNNSNPPARVYPPPETVHYTKDGVNPKGNTEEHKALVDKLVNKCNFNPKNFDCNPKEAKFFVIKSYSEDDIHRSIKYSVWCSTENGNKKLDAAFKGLKGKGPMYLLFSVNGSGHFCGVGEMKTAVDYSAQAGVWQQDKWKGRFEVKWIFIKDVPNAKFRHIIIESNEHKPVTNSRDTQEVPLHLGKEMLEIMSSYRSDNQTSILDSYSRFESRQKDQMSGYNNNRRGAYSNQSNNNQQQPSFTQR